MDSVSFEMVLIALGTLANGFFFESEFALVSRASAGWPSCASRPCGARLPRCASRRSPCSFVEAKRLAAGAVLRRHLTDQQPVSRHDWR